MFSIANDPTNSELESRLSQPVSANHSCQGSCPWVKILLLDSRLGSEKSVESMLACLGHPIVKARSVQEILQRLSTDTFALMILDVAGSGMEGVELARTIQDQGPQPVIPIVFITAGCQEAETIAAGCQGSNIDFLVKPVTPEVLRARVRMLAEFAEARQRLEVETAHRRRAEEALRQANESVEARVVQLTAKLSRTDEASLAKGEEQKESPEALRESLSRYRRHNEFLECIVATAGSCIAVLHGHELRYIMANPTFQAFAQGKPMIGKTYAEVFPEAAAAGAESKLRHVLETGEPWVVQEYQAPAPGKPDATWQGKIVRLPVVPGEEPSILAVVWDITGRKRAEKALQKSESLLRSILASLAEGLVVHAMDGTIIDCNRSAEQILGLTRNQILGRDSTDARWKAIRENGLAFPGEEHPAMVCLRTGQPCLDVTMGLHLPDGSHRWISVNAEPMFKHGNSQPCGVVASFLDITQRKSTDSALRESELRFSRIFHSSPAAIGISRLRDGDFLDVNDAFLRLHDYSREEIVGHTSNELHLWHSGNRALIMAELQEKKRIQNVEMQGRRKHGEVRDLLASIELVELFGEPCILGILTDVTDLRRTENALKESEERLRELSNQQRVILDTVAVGIGHGKDRKVQWANPAFDAHFGYERGESVGLETTRFFARMEDYERVGKEAYAQLKRGAVYTAELELKRKDGSLFWCSISAQAVEPSNLEEGSIWIFQDITQRKRAESALRSSGEQLRALAGRLQAVREEERTRIAREIHDVLAQELTRIKLDIAWFNRRLAQPLDDSLRAEFQKRTANLQNAADTAINAVQRIATELRPVILDSFGLHAAIEWQASEFTEKSGIHSEVKVTKQTTPLDHDRSTALFRILQESLTNIVRHAGATRVEINLNCEDRQVILAIQDNGRGIEPARLTDPRAVGLLGMRERASLLGGECEISGSPGKGTKVQVKMPIRGDLRVET